MNGNALMDPNLNNIPQAVGKYSDIKLIVIDVDGTLTDAGIYYDEQGNELKKFCTKDAAGFFTAKACGIRTMILTGRECAATTRRMKEMQADYVIQNVKDKYAYLNEFMRENNLTKSNVAYIGDDLNDYECMTATGFVGCPRDAVPEISEIADYVATVDGGKGAVRDVISQLLKDRKQWQAAISKCYKFNN